MITGNKLHIYEEILLLALRDKKGSTHFGVNYQFAMAGAIVAELLLDKKIEIEKVKKKKFVKLVDGTLSGDDILDETLQKLQTAKRRQRVEAWVSRLANIRRIKHRAAENLCKKRILKMEEDKVLMIFRRKLYPEINPKPEKQILNKMFDAIFTEKRNIDPHTLVLISICHSTGMLKPLFDKKKLRERKSKIKEIVNGNLVGKATKEAVEAMQAAVMVATIIPVVTATAG